MSGQDDEFEKKLISLGPDEVRRKRSYVDIIKEDSGRALVRFRMWSSAQSTPLPDHAKPSMILILAPDEAEETGQALVLIARLANQLNENQK